MKKTLLLMALLPAMLAAPVRAHTGPGATAVTWEATPCAVACSYWIDSGFTPCANPFPPGSYDDVIPGPAPEVDPGKVTILNATIDPVVDWDLFVCVGNPPTDPDEACTTGDCVDPLPDCDLGCHEHASIPVRPGRQVMLRAYNWSDPLPATGAYWYLVL